jgi:UDP-GlcNAc:undecaprenyl-phosphate GlcNAc-1-phosphate transferase
MVFGISVLVFWVLLGFYDWAVRSSEQIAGGLLIGRRRRRKHKVVSGSGIALLGVLFWGGYGWGAETTVISFMVILGFIDDWKDVAISIRLLFYSAAVGLIMYGQGWMQLNGWLCILVFVGYLGVVNAVNFMDGINGMVALQSIVILVGMLVSGVWMGVKEFLWILLGFVVAFSFFNVRRNARLFLGDAGSVGLGFVLFGLVLWKLFGGLQWGYLLYFIVFLLDTGLVILGRLIRRENIFTKHYRHLYQRMVRGLGWSELLVSLGYALLQGLVIGFWEWKLKFSPFWELGAMGIVLMLLTVYLVVYRWVVGKEQAIALA